MYKKMNRVTVDEAAARLGVKEQAVRKRIQRGTIAHDKDEDGRIYVYLDAYENRGTNTAGMGTDTGIYKLVDNLQEQVSYLKAEVEDWKEESRRKDHLLAAALERIPALEEAPLEARESPESASGGEGGTSAPPESGRPSWWRRMFS